jgi:predicted AlkP superfamily pyrophosphatase or phosphodiesterase
MGAGGSEGLIRQQADRVVVFYVDGLGYERYLEARDLGIIGNITSLGEPMMAVCQYPSISQVNADSLVTGLPSDIRAGNFRSYYPSGKTVLETVEDKGMTALWVAGRSTPVNMGDLVLCLKNFDSNGYEANEVAEEAIRQYCDEDIDLMFVHFKDPDKIMHINGPYSEKGRASLAYVDEQMGRVMDVLEPGTVVVVFSDHGGHNTIAGGNHGTLLPADMVVPIIVHVV